MLALAFCWAWHVGAWRHKVVRPTALKTHQKPAKSLFRYGFDGIRQAILNAADEWEQLEHLLSLLRKVLTSSKALPQLRSMPLLERPNKCTPEEFGGALHG